MTTFGDRLLILLVGGTAVGGLLIGWIGGFVFTSTTGWYRIALVGLLVVLFVAILIGIWIELDRVDSRESSD